MKKLILSLIVFPAFVFSQSNCTATSKPYYINNALGIAPQTVINGVSVIKKTGLIYGDNAGGSTNVVLTEGDYLTYRVKNNSEVAVGLSPKDYGNTTHSSINYSIYNNNKNRVNAFMNGIPKTTGFGFDININFPLKIAIEGGQVKFYKGNANAGFDIFYTSPYIINNPKFVVDFSMISVGSEIIDLKIFSCCNSIDGDNDGVCDSKDIVCPQGDDTFDLNFNGIPDDCDLSVSIPKPFTITNAIGINSQLTNNGYLITKASSSIENFVGGSSNIVLRDGDYFSFKASTTATYIGLSTRDINTHYNSINFALFIENGKVYEQEGSIYTRSTPLLNHELNNTYKIGIQGGRIFFFSNNNLLYISTAVITTPKVVDFTMCENNAQIINLQIFKAPLLSEADGDGDGVFDSEDKCLGEDDRIDSNNNGFPDKCENLCNYESKVYAINGVGIQRVLNAEGSIITKVSGGYGWNAGGTANLELSVGDYITYKVIAQNLIVGLKNTGNSSLTIDYGLVTSSNGAINIIENGVYAYSSSYPLRQVYNSNSTFKILRDVEGKIKYFCDDKLIHVSYLSNQSIIFRFAVLINSPGDQIVNLQIYKQFSPNTIILKPESGAVNQQLCNNIPLTTISYSTTGVTGVGTVTGLPEGIISNFEPNTLMISGTPKFSGIYNYVIPLTGGCGSVSASGELIIKAAPERPIVTITQPSLCNSTTGSVLMSELPTIGTWSISENDNEIYTGSGTTHNISNLLVGEYLYSVTFDGCKSDSVAINIIEPTTTWTGTEWYPIHPTDLVSVIINGIYTASSNGGNFNALALRVNSNAVLNIDNNHIVTVKNCIVNEGIVNITNHGSLKCNQ